MDVGDGSRLIDDLGDLVLYLEDLLRLDHEHVSALAFANDLVERLTEAVGAAPRAHLTV